MGIADVPLLIDQVEGGPVTVVVRPPGFSFVVLGYRVRDIQVDDRLFEIIDVGLISKLGIMVADDH